MIKIVIISLLFYFAVLLQVAFLPHFSIYGISVNLLIIAVLIISLLGKTNENRSLIYAFAAGFFLDIFSDKQFGFYILIAIALNLLCRFIFKKYIVIPSRFKQRYL